MVGCKPFTLNNLAPDNVVSDLHEEIGRRIGTPRDGFRLQTDRVQLDDPGKKLKDYGIGLFTSIRALPRGRGGVDSPTTGAAPADQDQFFDYDRFETDQQHGNIHEPSLERDADAASLSSRGDSQRQRTSAAEREIQIGLRDQDAELINAVPAAGPAPVAIETREDAGISAAAADGGAAMDEADKCMVCHDDADITTVCQHYYCSGCLQQQALHCDPGADEVPCGQCRANIRADAVKHCSEQLQATPPAPQDGFRPEDDDTRFAEALVPPGEDGAGNVDGLIDDDPLAAADNTPDAADADESLLVENAGRVLEGRTRSANRQSAAPAADGEQSESDDQMPGLEEQDDTSDEEEGAADGDGEGSADGDGDDEEGESDNGSDVEVEEEVDNETLAAAREKWQSTLEGYRVNRTDPIADGSLVLEDSEGRKYEIPADRIEEYVKMMSEARFLLYESTERSKRLRLTFKLKTNGMRKQLPYFQQLLNKADLQYCDSDVDQLLPILDGAIKNRVNIRGRRKFDIVLDEDSNAARILTDVVVNYDESNVQQVQNALAMIVKNVIQTYSAKYDTGIIKFSEELHAFRSPLLTDADVNNCYTVRQGQDTDDPLSSGDFVAYSTVLYARTQQASALFKTFATANQVLYDFPSQTICESPAVTDKLNEVYATAIGTHAPLTCTVESFLHGDKLEHHIYEQSGVCLFQLSRGSYVQHDHNRCCFLNVPEKGRNVNVVCIYEGCCPNCDSGSIDELRCIRPLLQQADGDDDDSSDDRNQKPTRKEKITEQGVNLVRSYINEHQLKKDGTYVFIPRENYQWDYVYALYEGETMDFEMLINKIMAENSELTSLIQGGEGNGANLWLFQDLVRAVKTMDLILPRLHRDRSYYGFEDGLMCIDSREGPCIKWIRWDEAQLLDIVVRKYVDYRVENKPVLYSMLVDGEVTTFGQVEELCPSFITLFADQGFDDRKFTWPLSPTENSLTDLMCGELGRLLYPLHKYDQFRHMLAPYGVGGTGKSAAVEIVIGAFIDSGKLHQVTSSTEEIFGLANADTKHVTVIPDAEPRSRGFGVSKNNFKLMVANEAVSIAIKHKDAKTAVVVGTPLVSTSNDELYKVFGPFQNDADEQAVKDRILSVPYTQAFDGDERTKLADVIKDEAGAILILAVKRYIEMINKAPVNSILSDWRRFMPFLQHQQAATDPLKAFIERKVEYKPRERQVDKNYIEHTISLRNFMTEFGGDITWQEMEKRLPQVLDAINTEQFTSLKYDKGETFYACKFCHYHLAKNRHTSTAEVFCCEEFEDAHGQDGFQLKDGCICYEGGASKGKPKKFKTLPVKTMDVDNVEGPLKVDIACIKNAGWS